MSLQRIPAFVVVVVEMFGFLYGRMHAYKRHGGARHAQFVPPHTGVRRMHMSGRKDVKRKVGDEKRKPGIR